MKKLLSVLLLPTLLLSACASKPDSDTGKELLKVSKEQRFEVLEEVQDRFVLKYANGDVRATPSMNKVFIVRDNGDESKCHYILIAGSNDFGNDVQSFSPLIKNGKPFCEKITQ